MNTARNTLIQAINSHAENMNEKELEMVLRFVYSLEDFREVTA